MPAADGSYPERGRLDLTRSLAALLLFGIGFGYVEAAVVVYLRGHYDPLHEQLHSMRSAGDLFPLLTLEQLDAGGPRLRRWLVIEVAREFATIVMLAAVGLATGRNLQQGFASFVIAFGVWDIAFYLFLKVLIDWPGSLFTWDLLFLIPLPWTGPVVAPMLVAVSMIATGAVVLFREAAGRPFRLSGLDWGMVVAGGLVVCAAFCWDYRNVMSGGYPRPFHWTLFFAGEAIGLAGFCRALLRPPPALG